MLCEITSDMGFWAFLATILGGGTFLGTVFGFIKWWLSQKKSLMTITYFKFGIDSIQAICSDLDNIRSLDTVDEVIIFRAHNDGGLPQAGHPFYVSSVLWSLPKKQLNTVDITLFKRIDVASDSIDFIVKVFNDHSYTTSVEDLKDGYTKTYFQLNEYKTLTFKYLSLTENNMFFIVLASKTDFSLDAVSKSDFIIHRIAEHFNGQ